MVTLNLMKSRERSMWLHVFALCRMQVEDVTDETEFLQQVEEVMNKNDMVMGWREAKWIGAAFAIMDGNAELAIDDLRDQINDCAKKERTIIGKANSRSVILDNHGTLMHLEECPEYFRGTMENYLLHGLRPGGFVCSMLANDLHTAWGRADGTSRTLLWEFARYICMRLPGAAYGSYEQIDAWIAANE